MNQIVNYIQLASKLVCMLRTYRTCNSTVGFSKYEFNNKLLGVVTLLRVLYIYIYICLFIYLYLCINSKH